MEAVKLIKRNGAIHSKDVTKNVTHLVTTHHDVLYNCSKGELLNFKQLQSTDGHTVEKARSFEKVKLVKYDWLVQSIKARKVQMEDIYYIDDPYCSNPQFKPHPSDNEMDRRKLKKAQKKRWNSTHITVDQKCPLYGSPPLVIMVLHADDND